METTTTHLTPLEALGLVAPVGHPLGTRDSLPVSHPAGQHTLSCWAAGPRPGCDC